MDHNFYFFKANFFNKKGLQIALEAGWMNRYCSIPG